MALSYKELRELVLRGPGSGRFTQDSPVLPDVWIQFARDLDSGKSNLLQPVDLLLTPHRDVPPARLLVTIREVLEAYRAAGAKQKDWPGLSKRENPVLSLNRAYVVGKFYFDEVFCVLLPLTKWWHEYAWRPDKESTQAPTGKKSGAKRLPGGLVPEDLNNAAGRKRILAELSKGHGESIDNRLDDLTWLIHVVGTLELERRRELAKAGKKAKARATDDDSVDNKPTPPEQLAAFSELLAQVPKASGNTSSQAKAAAINSGANVQEQEAVGYPLWSVALNRSIKLSIWRSVEATKADAARRLFDIHCDKIRWAVVDSGIDARHPGFRNLKDTSKAPAPQRSRIVETYDFTRLRELIPESGEFIWDKLRPKLRVPHDKRYQPPEDRHGTHVAGIIGMDWRQKDDPEFPDDHDLVGLCPDIELFDLRVLGPQGGTEFDILGALQYIRWLNANKDEPIIHGVNISISLPHDKANYACGRTPICEECERLMASGVVVVAAAGNEGWAHYDTEMGRRDGFRTVCITDPGNAEAVITVGATHRFKPHTYGVSYFSSRGPTGDGRIKPDLVAPGEKIKSAAPAGEVETLDGTSMAAPHVSGAAALLMARHHELIGQPQRIKEILCRTATDLGRERYFQGAGMLDVLRALQSV